MLLPVDHKYVVWFEEVNKGDVGIVGGKGANLGEMINAHIPVPPGFIVTAGAYFDFLAKTGISDRIRELLQGLDVNDSKQLQRVAERVQQVIMSANLPSEHRDAIKKAYETISMEKMKSSWPSRNAGLPFSPRAPFSTG